MADNSNCAQTALISGATGFVGANLAARLVKDEWNVHIIARPSSDLSPLDNVRKAITVHVHEGSTDNIIDIVGKARPTVVVHLASLFLSQHGAADIAPLIHSNVTFATQLLEGMAQHNVQKFINTGSSWQFHEHEGYRPVNLYAATKQAFQDILEYYCSAHHIKATTLALFDTYGKGDPRQKLIALLWRTALSQEKLLLSPGAQLLDLVHIEDVVDAFLVSANLLGSQEKPHEIYGVSSQKPMALTELVDQFEMANKLKLPIEFGGRKYRDREVMVPWSNYDLPPGWVAKIAFQDGIVQTRPSSL